VHRLGPEGRVRGGVGTVERHLELSSHTPTLAHTTDTTTVRVPRVRRDRWTLSGRYRLRGSAGLAVGCRVGS